MPGIFRNAIEKAKQIIKPSWEDLLLKLTGIDFRKCLVCGQGIMIIHEALHANKDIPI